MKFKHTLVSIAALASAQNLAFASPAGAPVPAATMSERGLEIRSPLKLDAQALLGMKPGEKASITFPVIGKRTVVFETTTKGLDGARYWHGSLAGSPLDRVYFKQEKNGFVGAIRFGSRQVAVQQQRNGVLAAVTAPVPSGSQPYTVGAQVSKGVYDLRANFAAMTQASEGSEINLPLPNGRVEVAIVTRTHVDRDGFVQIRAISRMGGLGSPTVITVGKDAVFGAVQADGREYQIVTHKGRQQLVDPQGAGWTQPTGDDSVEADWTDLFKQFFSYGTKPSSGTGSTSGGTTSGGTTTGGTSTGGTTTGGTTTGGTTTGTTPTGGSTTGGATTGGTTTGGTTSGSTTTGGTTATGSGQLTPLPVGTIDTTITLLMTYGPSYVAQWGSESAARTRMSNLVEIGNTAHANSGTGVQYRVVGWKQVSQADDLPDVVLKALRGNTGAFAGINTLKKSIGASTAVFMSPLNSVTGATGVCGLAAVPAAGAKGLAAYKSLAPGALGAFVNDGQISEKSTYCLTSALVHELGHNLGNMHDKDHAERPGVFSYSHGKGIDGVFGTVMAYPRPRVLLFSSPQLTCSATDPQPCGSSAENVVATILQTKSIVAAQGNQAAGSVSYDGYTIVTGWLLNADGSPYTGAATVKATNSRITCETGSTGLYVCKVPNGINSVTVSVTAQGKRVAPASGSFPVNPEAGTPINGMRFRLS